MGGNVERHIGDDDRDGAAIEAVPVAMSDLEIHAWIDACNHEPARDTLRHYLALRTFAPQPSASVADAIAALKAMPTRTEALGGQDFKYIQLGEALDTLRALAGDGK